jgi:hypothetical protein
MDILPRLANRTLSVYESLLPFWKMGLVSLLYWKFSVKTNLHLDYITYVTVIPVVICITLISDITTDLQSEVEIIECDLPE